jgi:hypothetical protein
LLRRIAFLPIGAINDPLSTLWLMLAAGDRPPWLYGELSVVSGLVTLVLVSVAARRLSKKLAWIPVPLAATSIPPLLYPR